MRSWETCKENQYKNLYNDDCTAYWHLFEPHDELSATTIPYDFYTESKSHEFDSHKCDPTNVNRTLNQSHNMFVGFSLVPKIYDCYVKCRSDIIFSDKIELKNEENTIYLPTGNDFEGINDQFAFGNYKVMKWYYELYLYYKEYWKEGHKFNPEIHLKHHLRNLNIVRIPVINTIIR